MKGDYIKQLDYLGFTMRLKRLSDAIIHSGRKLYKDLDLDIEPNMFSVFKLLEDRGPQSITEIAEAIGLSHPSVIAITKKMIATDLLYAEKDEQDARKSVLKLTPKAIQKSPEYNAIWEKGNSAMHKVLDQHKALEFLSRMEEVFEKRDFRQYLLREMSDDVQIVQDNELHYQDFYDLNIAWLKQYFYVEDYDETVLSNPKKYITDKGGYIFYALLKGKVVGTVALIRRDNGVFELSKMAVTNKFQGLRIGYKLMMACIDFTKEHKFKGLFLDSNTKLEPAINLYRKVGFVEIPVPEDTPYERCNIRMELPLD